VTYKKTFKKKNQKQIAIKRIHRLFKLAYNKAKEKNFELANRYVNIARKISMKYLTPIPLEFKRSFCKHCYSYLLPNINSRTRINKGKIIIFCKNCQKYTRIPYKPKK
jgi:ribonuclease P protein subunit RPR2